MSHQLAGGSAGVRKLVCENWCAKTGVRKLVCENWCAIELFTHFALSLREHSQRLGNYLTGKPDCLRVFT
ncbi:hypothetical protein [Microcoleus sp. D2_18a_D3]|uniref:hypothetical protein n=1 Tax=Microcoleus sp. D2_18a_D3 TaxID=3055330 RepID=UPI002FD3C305